MLFVTMATGINILVLNFF